MEYSQDATLSRCRDGVIAARLFAFDPFGLRGIVVRASAGPIRDMWLAGLQRQLGKSVRCHSLPCNIDDDRLHGGLDLAQTLRGGRPVQQAGLLAHANHGVVICSMAERLPVATAGRLAQTLDRGAVGEGARGFGLGQPTKFGVVALDESVEPDECVPDALKDRLAFHIDLTEIPYRDAEAVFGSLQAEDLVAAKSRLARVRIDDEMLEALCATALALGIDSLRAPLLAGRAACALAALDERLGCTADDLACAARLVLAPRAKRIPVDPAQDHSSEQEDQTQAQASSEDAQGDSATDSDRGELEEQVLAAAHAAIPPALLAALVSGQGRARRAAAGKAGVVQSASQHGRIIGSRRGSIRHGARLNILETLRAAVPWQKLRKPSQASAGARLVICSDDFRVHRYAQRTQTTTIVAIDASGSSALHRMAEAKGAVELLLAQCYVRRDQVAVVAFRGTGAELLLPPTRSLARAKRSLAGLPGGGATPLSLGIEVSLTVADAARRKGTTPTIVILTDGQANMSRDGVGGRVRAQADALRAADQVRIAGIAGLLIDTSPQPQNAAFEVATRMGARYLPLPHANAKTVVEAVYAAAAN